jgi:hypothetical protein
MASKDTTTSTHEAVPSNGHVAVGAHSRVSPPNLVPNAAPALTGGGKKLSLADMYLPGLRMKKVPRAPGRDTAMLEAIQVMSDYDSDGSAATWATLRLGNTGHTVEVLDAQDNPMPDGEARLNELAKRVWKDGGGGADTMCGTMFLTLYTKGGVGLQVVVTNDLQDVHDIYPFQPVDIEFGYVLEQETGLLDLAMFPARRAFEQAPEPLNPLQYKYLPVDPAVNDPYGRPPILPAVSALLKLMDIINEHLQVTRIQGFGMRDVKIIVEKLTALYPELTISGREEDLKAFINEAIAQASEQIRNLDPTETSIHTDAMEFSSIMPGGRGPGMNVEPMIDFMSRRVQTGLKKMPILLGAQENQGTQSTVQWQVEVKGITTFQDLVKRLLEAAYNTCLRVWGIAGRARVTFNTIRDTDRLIDAQADAIEYANERAKYEDGINDHATFSDRTDRHPPMGEAPPTAADQFRLQEEQALGQQLVVQAAADGTTQNDGSSLPDANQPGTDSGISAEEGAVLDQAGQNMALAGGTVRDLVRSLYSLGYDPRFFIPRSHLMRAGRAYHSTLNALRKVPSAAAKDI